MQNKVLSKSFLWMMLGLLVTFVTGYFVSNNEMMLYNIFTNSFYIIFIIVELALAVFLSTRIFKMQTNTARVCFILYSFISGLTFSSIFAVYNISSILYIFLITAFVFGIMSLLGYTTKMDLTKIGSYFIIGIFAVIIISIINILLLKSTSLELLISIIMIVLFLGVTAYDVQKIKRLENSGLPEENLAIYGALQFYLDFINIFIDLLRLFGRSRD